MANAQPGDTLIMRAGIWVDQQIKFVGNGTADKPIVLLAEEGGKVFITGKSYLRIAGEYLIVDGLHFTSGYSPSGAVIEFRNGSSQLAKNCRLTNTAIVDYNPSSINDDYKWVSLYGDHNRVDHCYFKGKAHSGTTLVVWMDSQPDYHLIDSNYFGSRPELGFNGGETIRIGTSDWSMQDSKTIVEYNFFERCDGETEIISNKSGHNIYRYNTFYESKGTLTLRHGNDCEVYGNFFFGNNRSNTGGIRIIGENHKVYNNYLQDLKGNGYRAAICMVKGVDNSPLNRYFQVKNAQVVNNTIVQCDQPFAIGYGSSSDQTLPPKDIKISNNVAYSSSQIIRYYTEPINPFYSANIFYSGPIGIDPVPDGITESDPKLTLNQDGLYRPDADSPLINAGDNSYDFITEDMDGQTRTTIDIGADEYSTNPVLRTPVFAEDVGPKWFPLPVLPSTIVQVRAGQDSLLNAINLAESGTVLELVTDGGNYVNSQKIIVDKNVIIRAKSGLVKPPVITQNSNSGAPLLFEIHHGGDLSLTGVELNGTPDSGSPAKYLIATDSSPFNYEYTLKIDSCTVRDVIFNDEGNFFRAYKGTKAAKIELKNSVFTNCGREGFRLDEESAGSGKYNVDRFIVSNCTFYDIPAEVISIYAGDNVPFTPGPKLIVDHSTFVNCGYNGTETLSPDEADSSIVKNSIFQDCSVGGELLTLSGLGSEISYVTVFNSGSITLNRGAISGKRVLDYDPKLEDASNANFTLAPDSPVILRGESKTAMGDLRWAVAKPTKYPLDVDVTEGGSVVLSPSNQYSIYDPVQSVTIEAIPDEGYAFTGFKGDLNSENNPLTVQMFGAIVIEAQFEKVSSVKQIYGNKPSTFQLSQNYPNPFNPSTFIRFSIEKKSPVRIYIHNVLGEILRSENLGELNTGQYEYNFSDNSLPSGVYFFSLISGSNKSTIKMNLVR